MTALAKALELVANDIRTETQGGDYGRLVIYRVCGGTGRGVRGVSDLDLEDAVITVWKFPFEITDEFTLVMPLNADIVLVEVQPGAGPCMWCKVDTLLPTDKRRFRLTGTGHPSPEMSWHLATFQSPPFVWHLWGVLETKEDLDRKMRLERLPRHRRMETVA